ncbi:MAG: SOS response-associated peptidase [Chloroflexi bacterium]|nr:SOS response-associated peptidase [Chloroflexota bacterium]
MPGRITLTTDAEALRAAYPWLQVSDGVKPRYNIAPNSPVAVVTNAAPQQLDFMIWGLIPSWNEGVKLRTTLFNVRAESVVSKPTFRNSFKRRRCLVLADGVFEWVKVKGVKLKTPYYLYLKGHPPFAYAGLWDEWTSIDGSEVKSCCIITCEPNEMVRKIHHRMGVILHEEDFDMWLKPGEEDPKLMQSLLLPYPAEEMGYHEVSTFVTNKSNEGEKCILPVV